MSITFGGLQALLSECKSIVDRFDWLAKHQGQGFNVFEILDRAADEVKGHSALIGELLNPRGSHGQGAVFLKSFLNLLSRSTNENQAASELLNEGLQWRTVVEHPFALRGSSVGAITGRIDVLIESNELCVIIENKIYAQDQEAQLERYSAYAAGLKKQCLLVYLSLDGTSPSLFSLGDVPGDQVFCLSYRDDIVHWLDDCIRSATLIPHIRETLVQYQRLIRRISTGVQQIEMNNEISELLYDLPNLRLACEIERALPAAKSRLQWAFWQQLHAAISEMFEGQDGGFIVEQNRVTEEICHSFYTAGRKPRRFGLSYDFMTLPSNRKVAWTFEVDGEFYYGLCLCEGRNRLELGTDSEFAVKLNQLRELDPTFGKPTEDILWKFPNPKLNWEQFDNECVALANERHMQEVVKAIQIDVARICASWPAIFREP